MEKRYTKADLLSELDRAWTELNTALDRLTPSHMTGIRDPQGWTVKDHLTHIAAWERMVVGFLQGKPLYQGLGIDEQIYYASDEDGINAAIQEQRKDTTLEEAMAELRAVHAQLLSQIEPLSDDDLYQANSDFQPESSEERDERPVIGMIYSNSANHFREHQQWIEKLVAQQT